MYKYIFFDLDGTLTDPGIGITNAVMNALTKFNIDLPPREELYKFIGPPLRESFSKYYGLSAEEAEMAVVYYREYYSVTGLLENKVYPGIPELLGKLKSEEYKIVLATSKPDKFSIKILEYFDLIKFFDFTACATFDATRSSKASVIRYALDELKIEDTSEVLMVGDRFHDVEGARECGIDTIAVTYGYGDREEHLADGARFIADSVGEIYDIITKSNTEL